MRRTLLLVVVLTGVVVAVGQVVWRTAPAQQPSAAPLAKAARPADAPLPIAQVILFSSGVGYFQREGEVDGNTRVDLAFPVGDVNDLLKSLVLQDLGGGKIGTIGYDSPDPLDKTLKSFALDLTYNPSFGQLLNQARGEKVEVVMQQTNGAQPASMTGVIVGMEARQGKAGEGGTHLLNLLCAEGVRSLPLEHVQRVRLLNPALDGEFRRALEVLAASHDTQKKAVSLTFTGEGKRAVKVGYVVESPIWKTSYRLVLDKGDKVYLQGWAVVENTTDQDWNNVRMALVSGRPISFQMDLYQPLYVPRPTVEPELFASLRPPAYSGSLNNPFGAAEPPGVNDNPGLGMGMPGFGGVPGGFGGMPGFGMPGGMPGQQAAFVNPYQQTANAASNPMYAKLSYEALQQRRTAKDDAKKAGSAIAAMDPREGVEAAASGEEVGDHYQYVIDQRVNLARQKSAMIPIIDRQVTGSKVSIFNETVHPKFPLLGLKFKNTSGQHLMQGPLTVYEAGSYAGDARILDMQPDEERLLSYAVDLGTEVKAEAQSAPDQLMAVKAVKGVLQATNKARQTKKYVVRNRSAQDRVLIVEHPFNADWKLIAPAKPAERSRDVYRFQLPVAAGKTATLEVVEEQTRLDRLTLTSSEEPTLRLFLGSTITSPALKAALQKAITSRSRLAETGREITHLEQKLKAITDDQARLRANLEKVPPASAAYKRYLEKFDTQETDIEKLQAEIEQKHEAERQQRKEYEDLLAGLSVE